MPDALRSDAVGTARPKTRFPSEFGRFTLVGLLGQGGMGAVFEAELRGPGGFRKRIALKVLHASVLAATARMGIDLRTEARLGALLHHPGIVEIYDYGVTGGQPWISMEFVDGLELSDLLRGAGRPPATVAVELARQLAQALDHAHSLRADGKPAGFVHRDLKPSNVIIDREGRAKITDFGIAKASVISRVTTRAGVTKGTPAYMSPEQARGGEVDARSDLFSLGTVLYQVVMGQRLFQGGSPAATVHAVLDVDELLGDRAVLGAVDALVPGLGFVLRGCLQEDPDLRWGGADEVLEALELVGRCLPPGPSLREFVHGLPDRGRGFRGLRSVRGRAPVPVPHAPALPSSLPSGAIQPLRAGQPVPAPWRAPELLSSTAVRSLRGGRGERFWALATLVGLFGFALGVGVVVGDRLAPAPAADDRAWRAVVGAERIAASRTGSVASRSAPSPASASPASPASPASSSAPALVTSPAQSRPAPPPPPLEVFMPHPLEAGTVGDDLTFALEARGEDLLAVDVVLAEGRGVWRRHRMARGPGDRWSAEVPATAAMEGALKYCFELRRRGGHVQRFGKPEAPFVAVVAGRGAEGDAAPGARTSGGRDAGAR